MQLSAIYSDGMIFQREKEFKIYGKDAKGLVKAEINGGTATGQAADDGKFIITIPAQKAGGPYTLTITDDAEVIELQDIYAGDVFFLSGQSNMELAVRSTLDLYREEVKKADSNLIRMFQLPKDPMFGGKRDFLIEGSWVSARYPEVLDFSALGYFFAKEKFQEDNVPVGLVHAAFGGAHIESFISEETLLKEMIPLRVKGVYRGERPGCTCDKNNSCKYCYDKLITRNKSSEYVIQTQKEDEKRNNEWHKALDEHDLGNKEDWLNASWEDVPESELIKIHVPGMWEDSILGKMNGSVWVRKEINLPKEFVGHDVELRLGTILDADFAYVNGHLVGNTEYVYPPRRYEVPAGILKEGKNIITVRVLVDSNLAGDINNLPLLPDYYVRAGGFYKDMPYCIKDGDKEISLEGIWDARIGSVEMPLEGATFFQWQPTALFNSMTYAARYYSICGILFYQGESNCSHADDYPYLQEAMVKELRSIFGEDIPYIYAQLPDYMGDNGEGCNDWIRMQRAQAKSQAIDNSRMVVLHDLGQYNELHPQNKKDVGKRFYEKWKELAK